MSQRLIHFANFIVACAWLLFVISFFLPVATFRGTPVTGWQVFTTSLTSLLIPWVWVVEPRTFLFAVFPFTNGLMLVSPVIRWQLRDSAAVLAFLLTPCALAPMLIPHELSDELLIGFYCWNASFGIMALGCMLTSFAYAALDEEYYAHICRTHPPAAHDTHDGDPFQP